MANLMHPAVNQWERQRMAGREKEKEVIDCQIKWRERQQRQQRLRLRRRPYKSERKIPVLLQAAVKINEHTME